MKGISLDSELKSRLREMSEERDPEIRWDEACEGSARSLVLFVGPSPAGPKREKRPAMKRNCWLALWNCCFDKPLHEWSSGFRKSFRPLVEAIFCAPYAKAGKVVGRANLDWVSEPRSCDVQEDHMRRGAISVLKMIEVCSPYLVVAMALKAFSMMEKILMEKKYQVQRVATEKVEVKIPSAKLNRYHRNLFASSVTSPSGHRFILIKLLQHPARMYQDGYGELCGKVIRRAVEQITKQQPISVIL